MAHRDGFNPNDQPKIRAGGIAAGRPRPGGAGRERAAARISLPAVDSLKAISKCDAKSEFLSILYQVRATLFAGFGGQTPSGGRRPPFTAALERGCGDG
jgi:hypothetical protein